MQSKKSQVVDTSTDRPPSDWLECSVEIADRNIRDVLHALFEQNQRMVVLDRREPPHASGAVVVGIEPDLIWELQGEHAHAKGSAAQSMNLGDSTAQGVFPFLRSTIAQAAVRAPEGFPACAGGLMGFLGYDLVRMIHPLPALTHDTLGLPDACLIRPTVLLLLQATDSGVTARIAALAASPTHAGAATAMLRSVVTNVCGTPVAPSVRSTGKTAEVRASIGRELYGEKFAAAMSMIEAGDARQIGISQRYEVDFEHSPVDLYDQMSKGNPSPLAFLMKFEGFAIVGTSPRVLAHVHDGMVTTRPIGGTTPRPADRKEDALAATRLTQDVKEVDEHLMLYQSWWDDLEPIVKDGRIEVLDKLRPEFFSHVIHLGSSLRGELDSALDAVDVLRGVFPAPTVVGTPKAAAIRALEQLESDRRGIYGGCVGYFGADGEMEMHIAIRTALVRNGTVCVQAGAGIVPDSDLDYEYREMERKASAVLSAVRALDIG